MTYQKIGMDFLIKSLILVTICSCSTLDITKIEPYKALSIFNANKQTSAYLNNDLKDPYYLTSIINDEEALFTKVSKINNYLYWSSDKDIGIKTYKGKIVSTSGLENDLEIILDINSAKDLYQNNSSINAYIRFTNPGTHYLEITYKYRSIKSGTTAPSVGEPYSYSLIEEEFHVSKIGWKGKNFYWIDEDGDIRKSKQAITPFSKKIRYELIKK